MLTSIARVSMAKALVDLEELSDSRSTIVEIVGINAGSLHDSPTSLFGTKL